MMARGPSKASIAASRAAMGKAGAGQSEVPNESQLSEVIVSTRTTLGKLGQPWTDEEQLTLLFL